MGQHIWKSSSYDPWTSYFGGLSWNKHPFDQIFPTIHIDSPAVFHFSRYFPDISGVGKCPFLGILNITFKYLLDIISPIVGWCEPLGHLPFSRYFQLLTDYSQIFPVFPAVFLPRTGVVVLGKDHFDSDSCVLDSSGVLRPSPEFWSCLARNEGLTMGKMWEDHARWGPPDMVVGL